jgi:uncharacterized protein (TIGR02145 family)
MKRILLFIAGLSLLISCEYQDNGVTSINDAITKDYLIDGNLDVYLQNAQVFRHKGKPGIETITIGNENLSDFEDCFVMYVASGTTQATTVSSAIIKLDGMIVLNTSDFSKNTGQHKFEVCNLIPSSALTVEVRGEPGSYIDIWIEGKKKELTVSDCDGNIYKTVKIGEQIWMAENLRTTKLSDCSDIPNEPNYSIWVTLSTPAYCWFNNDISFKNTYGALYNHYAVNTNKLCPVGWHVPSDAEWMTLEMSLGMTWEDANQIGWRGTDQGTQMKATSTWNNGGNGTNSSGFTALAGGGRYGSSEASMGNICYWLTTDLTYRALDFSHTQVNRYYDYENAGHGVRCVKDN